MSGLEVEDSEIQTAFENLFISLDDNNSKKVIRSGNAIAKGVLKEATPKRNGISESHHIVDDLTSRTMKEDGQVKGIVYYKGDNTKSYDDGNSKNKGYIARFLNDGFYHTSANTDGTKKNRSNGEYIQGKHFVEKAANEAESPAEEAMLQKANEVIDI